MSRPGFWDREDAKKTVGVYKQVKGRLEPLRGLGAKIIDVEELFELAADEHDEETLGEVSADAAKLESELAKMEFSAMLSGEFDQRDAYVSINAGAGGVDACSWAEMLLRMYSRYLERNGYKLGLVDQLTAEEDGIKSATIHVKGDWAYGYLKGETGVHRLVRISPYDAGNRRHTSFASVAVVADLGEDMDIEINKKDVREDFYCASGAGGQHVNTSHTAVRLTHLATGLVVTCQNERSQARNRDVAWSLLKARLHEQERKKQEEQAAADHEERGDIAWGNQIRSYVMHPYSMVKDRRTGIETSNVQAVLDGSLEEFVEGFLKLKAS